MKVFEILKGISIGSISLATILSALVIFVICVAVIRVLKSLVQKALNKSKLNETLKRFITTAANALFWVIAIIIVSETLGIPTASLVAVVSIAGLALSLAVQNVMANIFSGITLLITNPFKAGDRVDIGANEGVIKHISLFYTVMATLDNRIISIPNSDVTAASIVNYSTDPLRRVDLTFCASYECETEDVKKAIMEAASETGKVLADPAPFVAILNYKESSIEYVVRLWVKNDDYWDVYFGMNELVRESFKRNGVAMTYNHLNIHVAK